MHGALCQSLVAPGLEHLGGLPLTKLELCSCGRLENAGIALLSGLPLTHLDLAGCCQVIVVFICRGFGFSRCCLPVNLVA